MGDGVSTHYKKALDSLDKCQTSLFKAKHFEDIRTNLTHFKKRYDTNAGELIRLREAVPHFLSLPNLTEHRICECLENDTMEVGSYPQRSHLFSTLMLVRCTHCGCAYVPRTTFNLDDYYKAQYAHDVQQFRTSGKAFFSPDNDFLSSKTYARMQDRARLILSLAGDSPDRSILDFGCGVGILLNESVSHSKHAVESDAYSIKILKNELGVNVTTLDQPELQVDAICASHVLEHLAAETLRETLAAFHRVLTAKGKLVVFVPDGADHINRLKAGSRDGILFEPHTLHFSLKSLLDTMAQSKFRVTHVSTPSSVLSNPGLYPEELLAQYTRIPTNDLAIVAERIN